MNKRMAVAVMTVAVSSAAPLTVGQSPSHGEGYARARAEIEDLHARHLFALDWLDADSFVATFTEDGVMEFAGAGAMTGHEQLRNVVNLLRSRQETLDGIPALGTNAPPPRLRHFISGNLAVSVNGDTATSQSYWFEFHNDSSSRVPYLLAYGHYEDELRRENGRWLFSKRTVYNETVAGRMSPDENPARVSNGAADDD